MYLTAFVLIMLVNTVISSNEDLTADTCTSCGPQYELGPCAPSGVQTACSPNYGQTTAIINFLRNRGVGFKIFTAGFSVQERPIRYVEIGSGPKKYYTWGRIHGNECVGTGALLRVLARLTDGSIRSKLLLQKITVIILPIANPDGSEVFTRQNANGVDLNRDWCLQGQDFLPSPCNASVTQFPPLGVVNPPCSCAPGVTPFTQPETNALWDTFLKYLPDVTLDIHQFGTAFLPGTTKLVTGQAVIPSYKSTATEEIVVNNFQIAQVLVDSIRDLGFNAAVFNLTSAPGAPGRSSSQIALAGRRNINDTETPRSTNGLEMRRVCPIFETNLEKVTARIVWDQLVALSTGKLLTINPDEVSKFPLGAGASCTGTCPTDPIHIDEDEESFGYSPDILQILTVA